MFNFTARYISMILQTFQKSKLHEVRKYKSLLNSLQNLAKNEVTSQLKKKNLPEIERAFLKEIEKAEEIQGKRDATYVNLVVANTLAFMLGCGHLKMDLQGCSYDIVSINLLAEANILDYFKEMRYDLEWAASFIGNPLSSAR